jgi:hypothetical protein
LPVLPPDSNTDHQGFSLYTAALLAGDNIIPVWYINTFLSYVCYYLHTHPVNSNILWRQHYFGTQPERSYYSRCSNSYTPNKHICQWSPLSEMMLYTTM